MKALIRLVILAVIAGLASGCQTTGEISSRPERTITPGLASPSRSISPEVLAELENFLIAAGAAPAEIQLLAKVHPVRPPEPEIDRQVAAELEQLGREKLPDLPITINASVKRWIDVFQTRHRKYFGLWLARSGRYIPLMRSILEKHGLPKELVYLAMVESGFSCRARSRAAAVGPWQFIRSTGKKYGLRIDAWVDERRDPIKATEAAARYLRFLYEEFGDWYLAAAGYNAGEARIRKALRSSKGDDFWDISGTHKLTRIIRGRYVHVLRRGENPSIVAAKYGISTKRLLRANGLTKKAARSLRPGQRLIIPAKNGKARRITYRRRYIARETANYVPKIIAAAVIAKNPERYGFDKIDYHDPLVYDTVILTTSVDLKKLARELGVSYRTLKELNPELRYHFTPPGRRDYALRIPRGAPQDFLASIDRVRAVNVKAVYKHRVAPGENPGLIAARYKVSLHKLLAVNNIKDPRRLRIGQVLKIPVSPSYLERLSRSASAKSGRRLAGRKKIKVGQRRIHILRPHETPGSVARRYGVKLKALMAANKLTDRSARRLRPGAKLIIPGPAPTRSAKTTPAKRFAAAKPVGPSPAGRRIHILKSGEFPGRVAKMYGVSLDALLAANNLTRRSARKLRPGRELIIPARKADLHSKAGRVHILKSGEYPGRVAKLYGVSLDALLAANNLTRRSARKLRPGTELAIP